MIRVTKTQIHDFRLFLIMRQIADMIFEYATTDHLSHEKDRPWLKDQRKEGVNSSFNQTASGFFLEIYYGQPSRLWTPWGQWGFGGSGCGSWRNIMPEILKRLKAEVYQEKQVSAMGEFGPVYKIMAFDDQELPEPLLKEDRKQFLSYSVIKEIWGELLGQYYTLKNEEKPATSEEKWARDDMIELIRGQNEPAFSDADIKTFEDLIAYCGQVVKYSRDGGKRWKYAKLHKSGPEFFSNGAFGICTDEEVMPNLQVHCRAAITVRHFERGILIRPATNEEIKGIKFSYDFFRKTA